MRDERFKKPYDKPPAKKEEGFKEAMREVCKIMRSREVDEDDRMMSAEEYIKERYNPQDYIVIPKWAYKIGANYRGNIVLVNRDETIREEVVVRRDGTIYLQ